MFPLYRPCRITRGRYWFHVAFLLTSETHPTPFRKCDARYRSTKGAVGEIVDSVIRYSCISRLYVLMGRQKPSSHRLAAIHDARCRAPKWWEGGKQGSWGQCHAITRHRFPIDPLWTPNAYLALFGPSTALYLFNFVSWCITRPLFVHGHTKQ